VAGDTNERQGAPLRTAVIGCGAIAEEHLKFLGTSDLVELEAVCDLSAALAEITRQRHGANQAWTDVAEMLAEVQPDVVHVLTPPRNHPDLVRRALVAGAHVICEKPLAPSAALTRELLEDAADAGRTLVETRNLLFNDIVLRLDESLASGAVGVLREIDVLLALDLAATDIPVGGFGMRGGVLHDYLPHLAYLTLHFVDCYEVTDVVGVLDELSGVADLGFDHLDALVRVGGVRVRMRVAPDVRPSAMRLVLRGDDGSLEADVYQPFLRHEGPPWIGKLAPVDLVVQGASLARAGARNLRDRLLQHGNYHGMSRMLTAVYTSLRDGTSSPIGAAELVASAELIDRLLDLDGRSG
jgi:predicted dehydrogenase